MRKLISLLKSRLCVALGAVVLISLLIWFGGRYLAFGEWRPLAAPSNRLILIASVLLIWAVWLQVQQIRDRVRNARLLNEVSRSDSGSDDQDQSRESEERNKLRERFAEAVAALRRQRRKGINAAKLPWYVVIGAPGSGKTTLLQNSGLNFPLAEQFGARGLRGVGGTRNCDWWFADQGVFLDTAGRYTTQDSDPQADTAAWAEFLRLLRRYRRRRPLNGVIVTVSASDLVRLDEADLREHLDAIRRRLDELGRQLGLRLPVYLIFTKVDLIAGFNEFFDDLDASERKRVWGASFPIETSFNRSASSSFGKEFDLLIERINTLVVSRIHSERDRSRRAAVLSFPEQLAAMREPARALVEGVFGTSTYASAPLLRGFYLTSGTQQGTPIDRLMGAVAKTFGLSPEEVQKTGARRRTFFIEQLLKEVILSEVNLAGSSPRLVRRRLLARVAGYTLAGLLTIGVISTVVFSYQHNRLFLAEMDGLLAQYPTHAGLASAPNRRTYFAIMLEKLEALSSAMHATKGYEKNRPFLVADGLDQGATVTRLVRKAYMRELDSVLLPAVTALFEENIKNNYTNPQKLYNYLEGYLMLCEPEHENTRILDALAEEQWNEIFPHRPVLRRALQGHFRVLARNLSHSQGQPLDPVLVLQARNSLRAVDLANLIYENVRISARTLPYRPLYLDQRLGLGANLFERKSGLPLSYAFPAIYTQPVFAYEVKKGVATAVRQFSKSGWVLGQSNIGPRRQRRLWSQVVKLYQGRYIGAWDSLLADLQVKPVSDARQAGEVAARLAAQNSPIKLLLELVRQNTTDMLRGGKKAQAGSAGGATASPSQQATRVAISQVLQGASDAKAISTGKPGAAITRHFEPLDRLVAGKPGAMPLDHVLTKLKALSNALLTVKDGDVLANNGSSGSGPNSVPLAVSALPVPLSHWLAGLTGRSASLLAARNRRALSKRFRESVEKQCTVLVRGRFPFDAGSTAAIPLENFSQLFAYGGLFDKFYKKNLQDMIDTSGRYWRWKKNVDGGPAGILREMQDAQRIRELFFQPGAQIPQVDFQLVSPKLGPGINKLVVEINGQKFTYRRGGSATSMQMKWPGPSPGHVAIAGYDRGGALVARFEYDGAWAFFRSLRAAHLRKQTDLRFLASFNFGRGVTSVVIQADNLNNPFMQRALRRFRCKE